MSRHRRPRRPAGQFHRGWFLSRAGQRPEPAHDRDCGTARDGCSRLAQRPARKADVAGRRIRCGGLACRAAATFRGAVKFTTTKRRNSMTSPDDLSRRGMLMKFGLLFNGAIGAVLAVPIVRYLLSPTMRPQKPT